MVTGLSAKQVIVGSIPTDRSEHMFRKVVRSLQTWLQGSSLAVELSQKSACSAQMKYHHRPNVSRRDAQRLLRSGTLIIMHEKLVIMILGWFERNGNHYCMWLKSFSSARSIECVELKSAIAVCIDAQENIYTKIVQADSD